MARTMTKLSRVVVKDDLLVVQDNGALTVGLLAGVNDSVAQKLTGIQKLQLKRFLLKVVFAFFLFISLFHHVGSLLKIANAGLGPLGGP
ncbi:hypothetical protein Sjap_002515 [Stephania japonica]|uniref:Uncharacterized protein n=1 Tax=Stephania japonica TaxID=461633 RepID=A0AAP0PU85_9MAGN